MPYRMDVEELDVPVDDTDNEELTEEQEEEEERLAEERSRKRLGRFARGCLEVAAFLLLCAAGVFFAERGAGIAVGYLLPPNVLALSLMAGSILALVVGMFSINRRVLGGLMMILCGWLMLFTYALANLQEPEYLSVTIPGTQQKLEMTLVSTYASTTLLLDEPILEPILSHRWKFPVHGRNIPLDELIELRRISRQNVVHLYYEGRLWAVYDPAADSWADVLNHEEIE